MKKIRGIFRLILIIILIYFIYSPVHEFLKPTTTGADEVTINISQGAPVKAIADVLKENEIIKNKWVFVLKTRLSPYSGKLRYGTFNLNAGMSLDDIIKTLATSGSNDATFMLTIPEGFSAEKIAKLLEEKQICTAKDFLNTLENKSFNYDFINNIPNDKNYKYKLQGFLFPSTYEFYNTATPYDIINTMLGEFQKQYNNITNNSNFSMYDIITIASLVEREAKIPSERSKIAGVIENRLKKGMILQIDATVIYAISDGLYDVDEVLYKHLKTDSPYNTYKYNNLPVGPICNPGIESIKAAVNPENHSYYYYHTDEKKKDGSHIFTTNLDDHNRTMN